MKRSAKWIRKLVVLAVLAVLMTALAITAQAADTVSSGTCGDNLTWVLDSDGTLTISGTGEMGDDIPWSELTSSIQNVVIEEGVTSICAIAFQGCSNLTSVTISNSVMVIGDGAFMNCGSLTAIDIPVGVTDISSGAFMNCVNLSSVTIPEGVTAISGNTFRGCVNLSSVTIPEGVTSIGSSAFFDCNRLTSIILPESVTNIGGSAFGYCSSLASITLPESVTTIGSSAFSGCSSLTTITIPDGVTSIGGSAFSGCSSLTSITIPEGVTSIGGSAFSGCSSLTTITIPDGVTSIGDWTFYGCVELTSITIPEGVTNIGNGVFYDCSSLTTITIPEGVTSVQDSAFASCPSLATVYYLGTEEQKEAISISDGNDSLINAEWIYQTASATVPTLNLVAPSLNFEDEIYYNVYYTASDVTDMVEMGLITFDSYLAEGTIDDALEAVPGYTLVGENYMSHTNGIPAKMLGDALYFKVYAKLSDGSYVYSEAAGYHAVAYAKDILANSTNEKMKALVVAMLNYGAAAQTHFDYKTDSLMNSFLTEDQQALVDAFDSDMIEDVSAVDSSKVGAFAGVSGGYSALAPNVAFEGAFAINFYFTPAKVMDGELKLYYWTLYDYNAATTLTAENATGVVVMEETSTAGEYVGAVTGIAAKQIDETVFVCGVYESEGVSYPTGIIAYSLAYYCIDRISNGSATMQEFAKSTVVYGSYAKAYFA